MSHFLDRLTFFNRVVDDFADGHGITTSEDRRWEDGYRKRWQHDKIVRSTHGVNCTGSCSWKIYVKGGIVTWETQQTDYPRTRPDLPNHEPRGCSRGRELLLVSLFRQPGEVSAGALAPAQAVARGAGDADAGRGLGVDRRESRRSAPPTPRSAASAASCAPTWDEVNEIIAAANAYTVKTYGPDRVFGFSPIPAMSMVSYAAGSRYLSLLGGVCMSFYDWYCDLPPASPQTWGEQTDVPESADWYNSGFLILWGSNVPQTRTPDAHFYTEVRYKGAKSVVICPDYSEASKFADLWISPKQGTDAALAMAMGHVILREFHIDRQAKYFDDYARQYTDMPMLVRLVKQGEHYVPERFLRASDFAAGFGETNNPEWKTVAYDETTDDDRRAARLGRLPLGREGQVESRGEGVERAATRSCGCRWPTSRTTSPRSASRISAIASTTISSAPIIPSVLVRNVPVKTLQLADGETLVASVFDLFVANYGVDRGFGGEHVAKSYDDDRALYAGLGGEDQRRAARPDHHGGARVRAQRREDQGPLDGDRRRRR